MKSQHGPSSLLYNKKRIQSITASEKKKGIAGDFSAFVMSSHTLKATHFKHGYFIISAAILTRKQSPHAAAPAHPDTPSLPFVQNTQKYMIKRPKRVGVEAESLLQSVWPRCTI